MKAGKAIIVGSGLGGLATAALLAKAGLSVTVYEKNTRHWRESCL
jgi:phytoene dehydrogenase-like protein